MVTILDQGTRTAKKPHTCDGFLQVDRYGWEGKNGKLPLPPNVPHRIEVGMKYHFQTSPQDGCIQTFKACEHCWNLINENELYGEDY